MQYWQKHPSLRWLNLFGNGSGDHFSPEFTQIMAKLDVVFEKCRVGDETACRHDLGTSPVPSAPKFVAEHPDTRPVPSAPKLVVEQPANIEDTQEYQPKCVICMDRRPEVVFIPCGHQNFCRPCAVKWKEDNGHCPIDRREITIVQPLIPL